MIELNALEYNGRKTSEFPFKVFVEVNDGINIPQRKTKIITTDQMHGAYVKTSDNYSTIEKKYKFYVLADSLIEIAPLFKWLNSRMSESDSSSKVNYLKPFDNPERYYRVLKVDVGRAEVDDFGGYEFDVVFTCQPFSFIDEDTNETAQIIFPNQKVIDNQSGIHIYPRLIIETTDNERAIISIGDENITIKAPNLYLEVECFPGRQNVSDRFGLQNECMIGEFFKIPPGRSGISATPNVRSIIINCRWGELM
ncbi:TPA: phage tail protein [Staphylococcus aureus]|nr:phage tail protein [Staphylococcus aureus]